ncbi:hypothetical protein A3G67_00635 [Candidatus Roizmanbacteria bacterium RIFCSPLOWO2_12_FULL_40_12]|nr:MAG: hypothetical protein A3H84_04230 [Candidatus Roizmanbacteria bacterium RIFCSPLOWO2_02_FULL_40_13]OGK60370.1 MAG: hypothetical protein A3G67_00635 [Candidatus Roizmanbacteria bacterium RIFCSPLOWO2_12_FULL_40_12]
MLQTFHTRLTHKEKFTPDVYLFKFLCINPDIIRFEAGQYVILQVPQPGGEVKKKLYSIFSPPTEMKTFDLVVKLVQNGIGSTYLSSLQLGDEVIFDGPAGIFTLKEEGKHNGRDKVFIATGTGIAPARSMILEHLKKHPDERFILLWGVPKEEDVYFYDEWKKLHDENPNFNFIVFLSRAVAVSKPDHFMLGRVNKGIDELHTKFGKPTGGTYADLDVYIAGDRDIVESIRQYLLALGADPLHVVTEKFV